MAAQSQFNGGGESNDLDGTMVKECTNQLSKSERVTTTTKASTFFNYLNNRRSVKIKFGEKTSLAKKLLGGYDGNEIPEEAAGQLDIGDLEDPMRHL